MKKPFPVKILPSFLPSLHHTCHYHPNLLPLPHSTGLCVFILFRPAGSWLTADPTDHNNPAGCAAEVVFFSLTQERHLEDIKTRSLSKHSNACDYSDVGFVNIWHILVVRMKTVTKKKKKKSRIKSRIFSARCRIYGSINNHQTGNKQMEAVINTCCSALTAWCNFLFW